LSNTNFHCADLQRASLALSNAISADFTRANLIGTNLSQTNLTSAIVTEAHFQDNPDMTQELERELRDRQAILE
jgi:uncharacterized protein YjbI with pentapeptide repeats